MAGFTDRRPLDPFLLFLPLPPPSPGFPHEQQPFRPTPRRARARRALRVLLETSLARPREGNASSPAASPLTAALRKSAERLPGRGSASAGAGCPRWVLQRAGGLRGWQRGSSSAGTAAAETLSGFLSACLSPFPHAVREGCALAGRGCTRPGLAKPPVFPRSASRVRWRCSLQGKAAWKPRQRDAAANTSSNDGQDFLLFLSTPLQPSCFGAQGFTTSPYGVSRVLTEEPCESYSAHLVARTC